MSNTLYARAVSVGKAVNNLLIQGIIPVFLLGPLITSAQGDPACRIDKLTHPSTQTLEMAFSSISNRTYSVETSVDFQQWNEVNLVTASGTSSLVPLTMSPDVRMDMGTLGVMYFQPVSPPSSAGDNRISAGHAGQAMDGTIVYWLLETVFHPSGGYVVFLGSTISPSMDYTGLGGSSTDTEYGQWTVIHSPELGDILLLATAKGYQVLPIRVNVDGSLMIGDAQLALKGYF